MTWNVADNPESAIETTDVYFKRQGSLCFIIPQVGYFHKVGMQLETGSLAELKAAALKCSDTWGIIEMQYLEKNWRDYYIHQREPFYDLE